MLADRSPISHFRLQYWRKRWEGDVTSRPWLPQRQRIDGRVAVLNTRFSHNFYHWMIDILPRLMPLRRVGVEADYYLIDCLSPFQQNVLAALGIERHQLRGERVRLERRKSSAVSAVGLGVGAGTMTFLSHGGLLLPSGAPPLGGANTKGLPLERSGGLVSLPGFRRQSSASMNSGSSSGDITSTSPRAYVRSDSMRERPSGPWPVTILRMRGTAMCGYFLPGLFNRAS